jgi:hypothetical protein
MKQAEERRVELSCKAEYVAVHQKESGLGVVLLAVFLDSTLINADKIHWSRDSVSEGFGYYADVFNEFGVLVLSFSVLGDYKEELLQVLERFAERLATSEGGQRIREDLDEVREVRGVKSAGETDSLVNRVHRTEKGFFLM